MNEMRMKINMIIIKIINKVDMGEDVNENED